MGFMFVLASNLITVPMVVRAIGAEGFGEAVFLLALSSPLMLVGSVLGQAVAALGAGHVGQGDDDGFRELLGGTIRLCLPGVALLAAALFAILPLAISSVASPAKTLEAAPFAIAIGGVAARQLGLVLQGVLVARKNFKMLAKIVGVNAAIEVFCVLIAIYVVPTVVGYLMALAFGGALSLFVWLLVMRKEIASSLFIGRNLRPERKNFDTKPLAHFAKWQSLSAVVGIFANQANILTLGLFAHPIAVAHFNIAARLEQALSAVCLKFSEVLLPHFGQTRDNPVEKIRRHYLHASFLISFFGAAVMGPTIALSSSILNIWLGPEYWKDGALQLRVLVCSGLINFAGSVFSMFGLGTGRIESTSKIIVHYSLLAASLTVLLIMLFGASLAGVGLIIAASWSAWMRVEAAQGFLKGTSRAQIAAVALGPVMVAIAVGFIGTWVFPTPTSNGLQLVARYILASTVISLSILAVFSLTRSGRYFVFTTLAHFFRLVR